MADRDGTCSRSRANLEWMVRGPQLGWAVRIEMIRASMSAESWCGQVSGLELFSARAPMPPLA